MSDASPPRPSGRRQNRVLRNLDEPLKLFGLLTTKSCGLLLSFYSGCYVLDVAFGVWTWMFGELSLLGLLGLTGVVGIVLVHVERHEDEHHVPGMIRFYLARPGRFVYSGAKSDDFRGHELDRVLGAGARDERR